MLKWRWFNEADTVMFFIYLILSANWEDVQWRGITIKRGQRLCTLETLANTLSLSVQRVRTIIKRLRSTGEITTETVRVQSSNCTLITISGYEKYQGTQQSPTSGSTWEEQMKNTRTTYEQHEYNNKNNYKKNNMTEEYAPVQYKKCFLNNVFLTQDQYDLLLADHGYGDTQELIKILSRYKLETGKEYSSDYHAIKGWVTEKLSEERAKEPKVEEKCEWTLDDFCERPDDWE